jgi:hypothetical protein
MSGWIKTMQIFDVSQETQLKKRVVAMAKSSFFNRVARIGSLLTVMLVLCAPGVSYAQADTVLLHQGRSLELLAAWSELHLQFVGRV